MSKSFHIARYFVMLLFAMGAALFTYLAWFGFTLSRAFHAQWLFANWSEDAANLVVGILFLVALFGIYKRQAWARTASFLSLIACISRVLYDAISSQSSSEWHLILGFLATLVLIMASIHSIWNRVLRIRSKT